MRSAWSSALTVLLLASVAPNIRTDRDARQMNLRAVRDRRGRTRYYETTLQDITARRRAEESLRELTGQLELLATTDNLTGLTNRRVFFERLGVEFRRALRQGKGRHGEDEDHCKNAGRVSTHRLFSRSVVSLQS